MGDSEESGPSAHELVGPAKIARRLTVDLAKGITEGKTEAARIPPTRLELRLRRVLQDLKLPDQA